MMRQHIIVYRDDYPLLFKQDDFIIAPAECVLGIIEVKSRADTAIGKMQFALQRITEE